MKVWLVQTHVSPYRIGLFQCLAETAGVDFSLLLLSRAFKARPYWKRDLSSLPFKVNVAFSMSLLTAPEHEFCINPFLLFKLLAERPDVVVCAGYSVATVSVWLWSLVTRRPYVIWTEATMYTDGRITGIRLWLRRLLARRASAFVEAGTLSREYVMRLRPDIQASRLFRAFNCVDNQHFMSASRHDRSFFVARGLPAKNLLFVGRLTENKGVLQLLEVYRRVVAAMAQDVGLILVGEGELRGEVERFRNQHGMRHLHMTGWLKNEETARYYALADAFVLLTGIDRNPLVIFEALAGGLPIIVSNRAGNAVDFIKNGVNGYIVDPLNRVEIVERVRDVLSWDEGRRVACERFSREVVRKANYRDAAAAFIAACRHALTPHGSDQ